MPELTQQTVMDWAASFGWSAAPVEPAPEVEQWVLEVPGQEGLYGSLVGWHGPPANMLTVRVNLGLRTDLRTNLASLSVADRLAFLIDLRLNMARYHAVEYYIPVASGDPESETQPPVPESVVVSGRAPVDGPFSRNEFWNVFMTVQRAITDVDFTFQRVPLYRMLP